MPVNKVVYFSYSPVITALEHLRVFGPLSHTNIQVINGIEGDKPNLDTIRSGDLVLFQRNFSSRYLNYNAVILEAHKHDVPVVMDLDDNLIGLPHDHPDRKWSPFALELPALLHAMISVDAITVTTPTLQKVICEHNKNVYVLPNYLDDSIWNITSKRIQEKHTPIQIAFIGTLTHQPDLEKITEPLRKIADNYKDKISFLFYGPEPPDSMKELVNVQHQYPVTYDYAEFAAIVRSISADIAIAPLNDTVFNRCKSPIKYMEYSAMGFPCVFSNVTPYTDVIKDGFNGFLADNPNEWVDKLSKLIEDYSLRNEILRNAQTDVRSNWMLHDHAYLWQNCYDQVLAQGVQENYENGFELSALGQIAEQIEEQIQKQAEKTASLNQTIQEAQAQINIIKEAALREQIHAAEMLLSEKDHSQNLSKERDVLKEECDRKTSLLEKLRSHNSDLEIQFQIMQQERENLKREIAGFMMSHSWRLTRPLRKISRFLRRGR